MGRRTDTAAGILGQVLCYISTPLVALALIVVLLVLGMSRGVWFAGVAISVLALAGTFLGAVCVVGAGCNRWALFGAWLAPFGLMALLVVDKGWIGLAGYLVAGVAGAPGLLALPPWLDRRARRRQAGLCEACGYPLVGIRDARCPECGQQAIAQSE